MGGAPSTKHRYVTQQPIRRQMERRETTDSVSLSMLTPRQIEVLKGIASGLTTKETAHQLGISVKTVETHRAAIMQRTKLRTVAALVLFAVREGLVHP
jgi:DNA-binding NarL/FixJ family response regulator